MNCEQANALLSAKLDGELTTEEQAQLDVHLTTCQDCQRIYDAYCALEMDLGQLETPPAQLKESVMNTIRSEKVVKFPQKRWMFGTGTAVAAIAAAFVLVIGGYVPELPIGSTSSATTTGAAMDESSVSASPMMRESAPESMIEEAVAESMDTTMTITAPMESPAIQETLIEVDAPMLTMDVPASQVPELADFPVEQDENGTCFCYVPGDVVEAICNNQDYGLEMPIGYLDPEQLYRIDCSAP